MPSGTYIRTEEIREKQRKKMTGHITLDITRKKLSVIAKKRKWSDETKKKISESQSGEKCKLWKGFDIRPHAWIERKLGKPNYCEICKRTNKKLYDWSNKDHKYKRVLKYWQRLCRGCHMKYDIQHNNRQFWGNKKII